MAENKTKKKIKTFVLIAFFTFIVIFSFFNAKNLIFGVKIKNVNITNNQKVINNILKVNGIAKNAKILSLNGREISIDQKGNFEETLALLSGYNLIKIEAEDKFGNVDEKNYQLMH